MVHGSSQFSNQTKCMCNVIFNLKTSSYLKISQWNPTPKVLLLYSTWIDYITSAILLLKGCNTALNISTDLKASTTRVVVIAPEATASFILTNKMDNQICSYKLHIQENMLPDDASELKKNSIVYLYAPGS